MYRIGSKDHKVIQPDKLISKVYIYLCIGYGSIKNKSGPTQTDNVSYNDLFPIYRAAVRKENKKKQKKNPSTIPAAREVEEGDGNVGRRRRWPE